MLRRLTSINRKRMAVLFVMLYVFCVVGPHAAVAFATIGSAVHCFSENEAAPHQHTKTAHVHAEGIVHEHGPTDATGTKKADDPTSSGTCCGLFSVTAVAVNTEVVLDLDRAGEDLVARPPQAMGDHPPGRLIRPPIA